MKTSKLFRVLRIGLALFAMPFFIYAQKAQPPAAPAAAPQLMKRVITKGGRAPFGVGGTVSVAGAPEGSVTITGWEKNEVEIAAEIEIQAASEADLAQLAKVNDAVLDPGTVHLSIITFGLHDREYMKKNFKKLPKHLLNLPWKVDYVIRVPSYSDLDVTMGKGALKISGVEGAMQLKAAKADAELDLTGGTINATFTEGNVNVRVDNRSWRGRTLNMNVATGTMNVVLPADFNADIDASVVRNGEITITHPALKEREENNKFTPKKIIGRAGGGGVLLTFVMGDGKMAFSERPEK